MIKDSSLFNYFSFIGRLCNTPEKKVSRKNNALYTQFLLKTKFESKDTVLPFVMFGPCVDSVCTKYKIGDVVEVLGQVNSNYNSEGLLEINFVVGEMSLLKKPKITPATEDRFKTIVALYDTDNITNRLTRKKGGKK